MAGVLLQFLVVVDTHYALSETERGMALLVGVVRFTSQLLGEVLVSLYSLWRWGKSRIAYGETPSKRILWWKPSSAPPSFLSGFFPWDSSSMRIFLGRIRIIGYWRGQVFFLRRGFLASVVTIA